MPYCHNCGTEIEEKAKFCHNCGAQLTQETTHPELSTTRKSEWLSIFRYAIMEAIAMTCPPKTDPVLMLD